MTKCNYYDCGWCYAPDDVSTSAQPSGACAAPHNCLYLKSQMTNEIDPSRIPKPIIIHDGNDIIVSGVRYRKVEEPPTLYDKLETWIEYGNFTQSKDVLVNEILNMVKEFIPEPYEGMGLSEYFLGYNEAINKIERWLK